MNDAEIAAQITSVVIARLDWSEGKLFDLTPKEYGKAAGEIYAVVWEKVQSAHYPSADTAKE